MIVVETRCKMVEQNCPRSFSYSTFIILSCYIYIIIIRLYILIIINIYIIIIRGLIRLKKFFWNFSKAMNPSLP